MVTPEGNSEPAQPHVDPTDAIREQMALTDQPDDYGHLDARDRFLQQSVRALRHEVEMLQESIASLERATQEEGEDTVRSAEITRLKTSLALAEAELHDRQQLGDDYRK